MTANPAIEPPAVVGLILAAGESSRMGTDKALLTYRGRSFLETIRHTLCEAGVRRAVVVLGHHAEGIMRAVNLESCEAVINPEYRRGQTSSLQAGLRALEGESPEAILLCLVDHPAISAESVRKVLFTYAQTKSPVVIPTFQNQHGHPVLIGRALFEELKNLSPNQGANTIIHKYRDATCCVEVNDPGILIDVDSPEAYRTLK